MSLKTMESVAKAISQVLQLDRLERMCKYHPAIAMFNAGLICDINGILLATQTIVFSEKIIGPFSFGATTFEPTLEGKLAAISHVFHYRAQQMCAKVDISNVADFVKGLDPAFNIMEKVLLTLVEQKTTHPSKKKMTPQQKAISEA